MLKYTTKQRTVPESQRAVDKWALRLEICCDGQYCNEKSYQLIIETSGSYLNGLESSSISVCYEKILIQLSDTISEKAAH